MIVAASPLGLSESQKVRAGNPTDGVPALMSPWFSCLCPVANELGSKKLAHGAYPAVRKEPMVRELVVICVARYGRLTNIGYVLPYGFDNVII